MYQIRLKMAKKRTYISFDWALKKMLRHKANFVILEGFLSELLREDLKVKSILESESNAEESELKINRVDVLVEDSKKRLIIIEVQYSHELDYFHRMLFATSKVQTEHIKSGFDYSKIKKAVSVNLLYFELGQGEDYIYHGKTVFLGLHKKDELQLSPKQRETFLVEAIHDIYPEYYVIKINKFNDIAKDTLDEWIYFLKNTDFPDKIHAKGLKEAQEKMQYEGLSEKDKKAYDKHQIDLVSERNVIETARIEGLEEGKQIGLEKGQQIGLEKGKIETAYNMLKKGLDIDLIADVTGLSVEVIAGLADD